MRFILATLLTATLSFIAGLYTPWWSIAIIAFLIALLVKQRYGLAFLSGFASIFLLWGLLASWIDVKNHHLLSRKMADIFQLGGSSLLLIIVTAFVGALVGGFAAMSGSSLRTADAGRHVK